MLQETIKNRNQDQTMENSTKTIIKFSTFIWMIFIFLIIIFRFRNHFWPNLRPVEDISFSKYEEGEVRLVDLMDLFDEYGKDMIMNAFQSDYEINSINAMKLTKIVEDSWKILSRHRIMSKNEKMKKSTAWSIVFVKIG